MRNRCGWTDKKLSAGVQAGKKWGPKKSLVMDGLGQEVSGCWGKKKTKVRPPQGQHWVLAERSPMPEAGACMLPPRDKIMKQGWVGVHQCQMLTDQQRSHPMRRGTAREYSHSRKQEGLKDKCL